MPGEGLVERLATGPQKPISEPHRFCILVIGALGCMCSSMLFAFNLISTDMQSRYNLSGRDISTISTVGLVVCYFLLPYGFIYDHFGPKPIFVLSTTLLPLGALLFALTFRGTIEGNVVRLSVFNAILSLGCTMFDLGCMVTVMSHFPANKGAVVAILKSLTGLGAAIVGSIQLAFFDGRPDNYFYFLIVMFFVVGVANFFFTKLPSYHLSGYEANHLSVEEKERRLTRRSVYLRQRPPQVRFIIGLALVIVMIVFLPLQSALTAYLKLGKDLRIAFAVIVIALVAVFPVMALPVAWLERRETRQGGGDRDGAEKPGSNGGEATEPAAEGARPANVETDIDYIAPQYHTTFLENIRSLKLWAIVWTFFCIVGSEFVVIFNANFIYTALAGEGVDTSLKTLLTVLNGVGSAAGRLLMSYFEVWLNARKAEDRIPITVSLFFGVFSVLVALVLFLVLPEAALPLPYVIAALGNGFGAAAVVLITRTIFAKDPAKHYNFCYLSTVFSTILLNRLLYGEWYTREAEKQGNKVCLGRSCVMMPFLFLIGINCTAFLSSVYVHWDYRRFSRMVLEERRRLKEEAEGKEEAELWGVETFLDAPNAQQEGDAAAGSRVTQPASDNGAVRS